MTDDNRSEFSFNGDGQEPESFYHEELKDMRVEKLSQRVTLLSILLPCLTAVAVYFGYQELSDRLSRSQAAGSLEVQRLAQELENLAQDFNEKLVAFSNTLSTQGKDFGNTIDGRIFAINKDIEKLQNKIGSLEVDLKRDVKQNQDTIEKLTVSKADKKDQAVAVEKIKASIKPLKAELQKLKAIRQDVKTMTADIKKLGNNLTQKMDAVTAKTERVGQEYKQLEASLTKLSNNTVEKDTLALEVFKLKKNIQNDLSEQLSDLNRRLDAIQKEIIEIELNTKTGKQAMKKISPKTISQPSTRALNTGSGSPPLPPQSGTITEKDLIE
jgi:DNA repair exonuclease SbcCD ATPase subunit